jgi:hypothetical protein
VSASLTLQVRDGRIEHLVSLRRNSRQAPPDENGGYDSHPEQAERLTRNPETPNSRLDKPGCRAVKLETSLDTLGASPKNAGKRPRNSSSGP